MDHQWNTSSVHFRLAIVWKHAATRLSHETPSPFIPSEATITTYYCDCSVYNSVSQSTRTCKSYQMMFVSTHSVVAVVNKILTLLTNLSRSFFFFFSKLFTLTGDKLHIWHLSINKTILFVRHFSTRWTVWNSNTTRPRTTLNSMLRGKLMGNFQSAVFRRIRLDILWKRF